MTVMFTGCSWLIVNVMLKRYAAAIGERPDRIH
jgi:hypothetical protein